MEKGMFYKIPVIYGLEVYYPPVFSDDRGRVQRMCRVDDPHMGRGMQEIYFSTIYPDVVKAWHLHKEMWLRYACIFGKIRIGLYDDRLGSPTRGNSLSYLINHTDRYCVLCIPPLVWNGFRCAEDWPDYSIVANCASIPHRPDEIVRMGVEDAPFDFDWGTYRLSG